MLRIMTQYFIWSDNVMTKITAEFESLDLADLACSKIKSSIPGIRRISITDKRFVSHGERLSYTYIGQGVNNLQPYVTVISDERHPMPSSAKVDIICDPLATPMVKKQLISKGGLKVQELS